MTKFHSSDFSIVSLFIYLSKFETWLAMWCVGVSLSLSQQVEDFQLRRFNTMWIKNSMERKKVKMTHIYNFLKKIERQHDSCEMTRTLLALAFPCNLSCFRIYGQVWDAHRLTLCGGCHFIYFHKHWWQLTGAFCSVWSSPKTTKSIYFQVYFL